MVHEVVFYDEKRNYWCISGLDEARNVLQDSEYFGSEVYLTNNTGADTLSLAPYFLSSSHEEHLALRKNFYKLYMTRLPLLINNVLETAADYFSKFLVIYEPFDVIRQYVYPYYKRSISEIIGISERDCSEIIAVMRIAAQHSNSTEKSALLYRKVALDHLDIVTEKIFSNRASKIHYKNEIGIIQFNQKLLKAEQVPLQDILLFSQPLFYTLAVNLPNDLTATLLYFIATNPLLQSKLKHNKEALYAAINESLRLQKNRSIPRVVNKNVNRFGKQFKKGDIVMIMTSNSGLDSNYFSHANTFDPERKNLNKLVVWGLGKHTCIGKKLAQAIAYVSAKKLLKLSKMIKFVEKTESKLIIELN